MTGLPGGLKRMWALDRAFSPLHIIAMNNHRLNRRQLAVAVIVILTLGTCCGAPAPQTGPELNILFQIKLRNQYDILCLKTEGVYPDSVVVLPRESVTPVWSPDHSKFVFSQERNDQFDLAVADADGGNVRYLTADTANDFNIASWFPHGDSIVFATDRNGNLDIYSIHADGTNLVPIIADSANEWHPIITPNGQRMLYVSDVTGRPRIWAFDFPSGQRRMVFKPDTLTADFEPAISPDGLFLAYSRLVHGDNPENFDIVLYDLIKNTADLIVADPATDRYPRFSPDGTKILFHSNRTGVFTLYMFDRGTRTTRPVNTGTVNSSHGDW